MVSSFKDFMSCRPTEVSEDDNLLCESRYIESEKLMKKVKWLKRFSYSSKVVEDEIYYFRFVAGFGLKAESDLSQTKRVLPLSCLEKWWCHKRKRRPT